MGRYKARHRRRRPKESGTRLGGLLPFGSSTRSRRKEPRKRARKHRVSLIGPSVLAVLLLVGVLYLLVSAMPGRGGETVTVVVEEGDTLSTVADKLEESGAVRSSTLFGLQARIAGEASEIKPGEYRLTPGETSGEILQTLSSGDAVPTFEITISEGLTLEQTAQRVAEQSDVTAEEFEVAARRTDYRYAFLDDPGIETTEGFLFPKTYDFYKDVDASRIVDRLLEQYQTETEDLDFREAKDRTGLTEYEIVTLASLIEKESASPEERPLIASVIYNRIRDDMPLQIDATIQYALDKPKERLTLDDLEIDSPYNTYTNTGLPPGPIASPSRESIEAAIKPAETSYLYYVLEADGKEHFFTDDYDEFLKAKKDRS